MPEECPKDYPQGIATVKQFVELLRRGQARNTAIPCFQDDPSSWRLGKPTRAGRSDQNDQGRTATKDAGRIFGDLILLDIS